MDSLLIEIFPSLVQVVRQKKFDLLVLYIKLEFSLVQHYALVLNILEITTFIKKMVNTSRGFIPESSCTW